MLDFIQTGEGTNVTSLHMLQLRMPTLHQFPVPRDTREHPDPAHPRKRHLQQHERWRSMEPDGPHCSTVTDTRLTSPMSVFNARTAKNHAK
jgi:hypothetical protein